ncbi:release factor glutamine methyltransferase [Lachnospiraceae bacterium NE2001]|jgi:release factor glutamine methyltransferase|nr:release factor glutamine methyltransferase [Lachnospiraceae bacterium NE2001]
MTKDEKKVGALINKGTKILGDAFIENNVAEARHLMMLYMDKDLASIYAMLNEELDDVTAMRYMKAIKKRATHYPLQYITGFTYFMEYEFICRENVLIPRFDTENLVLKAMELSPDRNIRVLDMCTGSGCIGISYQLMREEEGYDDEVYLSDISDDAIKLAQDNAKALGSRVRIIQSDLFDEFTKEDGTPRLGFDMILSNPPYIRTKDIYNLLKDVRDYEPRLALDGASDGLAFYRIIISKATEFLNPGGFIVLEIGYDQYMDVAEMLRENGFKHIKKQKDMSGLDRVVSARF